MIKGKADLHLHTTASDGTLSPSEVVKLAADKGLEAISITDHDSITGYNEARELAIEKNITLLPGVEITTDFKGRECHILAYNFDIEHSELLALLKSQRKIRKTRAEAMLDKLRKLGFEIDLDEVRAESGAATISRNHLALAMLRKRYVSTKREAFDKYLSVKGPAYVRNGYPSSHDVISLIRRAGGVSFLAHPGKYYIYEDLKYFLECGLDGIEYIHPSHTWEMQKKYKEYAENYGMLLSGGSDFHGGRTHEDHYLGVICVDVDRVARIIERSNQNKSKQ